MISKMKPPEDGGSRLAIVFNGSPLFTGAAGSGESEIRRWIIENDWLEAVVALPDQLFYNTGISTYFWIVTNRKSDRSAGARSSWSTPGTTGPRCASASETSARSSRLSRSLRSPACMRISQRGSRSRSSPTRPSASSASPSSGPCASATRLAEATLPALIETKAWAKLGESEQEEVKAHLADLHGFSTVDRRQMARKLGDLPNGLDKAIWEASRSPIPKRRW